MFFLACSRNKEIVIVCGYSFSEPELRISFISFSYNSSNDVSRIIGNVYDPIDSSAVVGAQIRLQSSNRDTIFTSTDFDGNFTIQFKLSEYDTLDARMVGYKRTKVDIRKKILEFSKYWIK